MKGSSSVCAVWCVRVCRTREEGEKNSHVDPKCRVAHKERERERERELFNCLLAGHLVQEEKSQPEEDWL